VVRGSVLFGVEGLAMDGYYFWIGCVCSVIDPGACSKEEVLFLVSAYLSVVVQDRVSFKRILLCSEVGKEN
jgi:hypothetical protein